MSSPQPFLFISVEEANGRPTRVEQKTVRSWITKAQHDHRKHLKSSLSGRGGAEQDATASPQPSRPVVATVGTNVKPRVHAAMRPRAAPRRKTDDLATRQSLAPTHHRQASEGPPKRSISRLQISESPITASETSKVEYDRKSSECSPAAPSSWDQVFAIAPFYRSLDDPTDMLSVYASELDIDPRTIWTHYLWQERLHGTMFRVQYPQFRGVPRTNLHHLILLNPTLLATTVLFSACHLRYQQGQDVMNQALLRIHSTTYRLVQAALSSPNENEQLSDATMLAVTKLAFFELLFGNEGAFETHINGVAQMVRLRNRPGSSCGRIDSYTAHILVWFDGNFSAAARRPRLFEGESSLADVGSPLVDTETFALGVKHQHSPSP